MKHSHYILLFGILIVGCIVRLYHLSDVPNGLYQDETAIGYNAYSLLETGKDEHGESWPVYFKSFGDYKLPVYVYLTALSVKIFGLTAFAVRFPSALFGIVAIVSLYMFVIQWSKDRALALMSSAALSINPWHIHYSRATFEVSIALVLFICGSYLIHRWGVTKKVGLFFLGTVCFVVALYTYNLTRLLSPILFLLCIWFSRKYVREAVHHTKARSELIVTVVVSSILLIPFVLTLFSPEGLSSASGTIVSTSARTQASLLEYRSYIQTIPNGIEKLFFNMALLNTETVVRHVISYTSASFYFLNGSEHGNHGIGTHGQFYMFEIGTILLGLRYLYRRKKTWSHFLILWWCVVVLVASLTREAPHATRSFFLVIPMIIWSSAGMVCLFRYIRALTPYRKYSSALVITCIVLFSIVHYFVSYFVRFPVAYASAWRAPDRELVSYITAIEDEYDVIAFDTRAGFMYSSYVFYTAYPPKEFHRTVQWEQSDSEGFSFPLSFGHIRFTSEDWMRTNNAEHVLFVSNQSDIHAENVRLIHTIKNPVRPVVIADGQTIVQFPIADIVYYLYEKTP